MHWPGRAHEAAGDADERLLIGRSQRGDVSAFNCLVERHQDAAYAVALRMLGEPEAAADVTQDAFFSAFRSIASFRGSSFRPWLLRIVCNACYDQWRARGRRPTTSLDALVDGDAETDGGGAPPASMMDERWDPERAALRAELVELLQQALLELTPEQRMAVVLSDVQGMSYEEIAEIMGTSLGTVKSRISRGRGHMRDLLRAHGELLPAAFRRANEDEGG
jgi:RNA polymerase sigma-70 factor (ECF subfamily)